MALDTNTNAPAENPPVIAWRQRFYKNPTAALEGIGQTGRAAQCMEVLLKVSHAIAGKWQIRELLGEILDILLPSVAADRGTIFLTGSRPNTLRPVAAKTKEKFKTSPIMASRTILAEVLRTRDGILTQNAMEDTRFQAGLSIALQKIHAAICVPLVGKGEKVLGIIHVDTLRCSCAFDEGDLKLVTAIAMQAAMALENALLLSQLEDKKRMEQELQIASDIQKRLLPESVPQVPGLEAYGVMIPAREVGGDYYDFVLSEDGKSLYICVGDVSGKGIPAGLVMVMARCFFRSCIARSDNPRQIICEVNRLLIANARRGIFMSAILLRWDTQKHMLSWAGAGQEHLLVYRAQTKTCEKIMTGGVVLGLKEKADRYFNEQELPLAPGDSVLLYSDGVTESRNHRQEMFELPRLVQAVQRHGHRPASDLCQAILQEVKRFGGNTEQHDDITLVALTRQ